MLIKLFFPEFYVERAVHQLAPVAFTPPPYRRLKFHFFWASASDRARGYFKNSLKAQFAAINYCLVIALRGFNEQKDAAILNKKASIDLEVEKRASQRLSDLNDIIGGFRVYGNLEGPAARAVDANGRSVADPGRVVDERVYRAQVPSLLFNFHPSVIRDLKKGGFTIVSTANNHALDRGPLSIDRTIDELEKSQLIYIGTRRRDSVEKRWSAITQNNGVRIGWLACTFDLNGFADHCNQVLGCYSQREELLQEIKRLANDQSIDAIIFTPHWGLEGSHVVASMERKLAREAIEAGATAVIGAHLHVLQSWEKYQAADGREGLIAYSTGKFISNQRKVQERAGIILVLRLVKTDHGKARIAERHAGVLKLPSNHPARL
jgi:hypothetical protein